MNDDALYYPYPSRRNVTYARKGMVTTSQPLASQAGLSMLKKGGNAIDAAIATAAALTVLEPTQNGIGSDCFALVWAKDTLYGLNSSGPSPNGISIDAVKDKGHDEMPRFGLIPVTVPGTPKGWFALSKRFGKLPFKDLFEPAIDYAENGFPVSPNVSKSWKLQLEIFSDNCKTAEFKEWFETFARDGRVPEPGEIWYAPNHAKTLRLIADTNSDDFYHGSIAAKIDQYSKKYDGFIRKEDLGKFESEWVEPIHAEYRGYKVWEIPPNGQGLSTLMALNILKGYEFSANDGEAVDTYHKQIEAMKLAFADGLKYITDPRNMSTSVEDLLSEAYATKRRQLITDQALNPEAGNPPHGETVYLATADSEGNMVSYIQSNYLGFGSGIVVPGTGIGLQNRGHDFSLDERKENSLAPNKRTYHTIIPAFLTKDNQAVGPFGVMGGYMQPQGHLQVALRTIDFHLNPQATLDAPRWKWVSEKTVEVEHDFPRHLIEALKMKGHDIVVSTGIDTFGRGQIIWRDPETNVLRGGSDPRADGNIASW